MGDRERRAGLSGEKSVQTSYGATGPDGISQQEYFLERLKYLLRMVRCRWGELNEAGHWFVNKAIFTTYCDCVEVGCGVEAVEILRQVSLLQEIPDHLFSQTMAIAYADPKDPGLRTHFLTRLTRLRGKVREHYEDLNEVGRWLVDRSTFVTFLDWVAVGRGG